MYFSRVYSVIKMAELDLVCAVVYILKFCPVQGVILSAWAACDFSGSIQLDVE